ncbi:MAG: pantetheine-phosphate adenylyltransferase [Furfurilactobacillus sp.]|jgi:pantetheine-phosphate adenylyltransferase|uniref:Phosphopantetheine adenylyltransferase n=1 Tax=Furfurilactobacillus milii TaxID=2888272 RepID=A0ABT6D6P9_9LACO|nr:MULTISPECIES: pantetheine-phosphate adenylyltransferase [Furfurilactobacillus]QLE66400.1 Phosphopantetheine adenylyltransferase [Furfurilactobacillus rossiae]MCF6159856.1 pantetheine-phosphate adenylyltransferase [Furfurilactobacillus milii]MCF6162595.1 pantetheine-phosphate adenylyltransferase [Furfurilactobacillus milii]MCF6419234.1 pantetheine-phosphate adenylyltransferase [Furfurilactobacillus milii]MCH4010890.1 pantetheine-phosphate adenylyltransferase [Furfurilactobacillus sp.]
MSKRIAVFPGSFDPLTNGHFDIIERASRMFDQLIVAVGTNTGKRTLFSVEEKISMIQAVTAGLPNVNVETISGLTVTFMHEHHATFLIRGLRNDQDFNYERDIANMNRTLAEDVESVFLLAKPENAQISSSILKEIVHFDGDVSAFVPAVVWTHLQEKRQQERQEKN